MEARALAQVEAGQACAAHRRRAQRRTTPKAELGELRTARTEVVHSLVGEVCTDGNRAVMEVRERKPWPAQQRVDRDAQPCERRRRRGGERLEPSIGEEAAASEFELAEPRKQHRRRVLPVGQTQGGCIRARAREDAALQRQVLESAAEFRVGRHLEDHLERVVVEALELQAAQRAEASQRERCELRHIERKHAQCRIARAAAVAVGCHDRVQVPTHGAAHEP